MPTLTLPKPTRAPTPSLRQVLPVPISMSVRNNVFSSAMNSNSRRTLLRPLSQHLRRCPLVLIIVIAFAPAVEPIQLDQPPHGHRGQDGKKCQRPPRQDAIPTTDPERERPSTDCRSDSPPQRARTNSKAVQRAQDAQAGGAVGEEDRGAGEGEDDGPAFEQHYREDANLLRQGRGKQRREGSEDIDDGEDQRDGFEAVKHAPFSRQRGED